MNINKLIAKLPNHLYELVKRNNEAEDTSVDDEIETTVEFYHIQVADYCPKPFLVNHFDGNVLQTKGQFKTLEQAMELVYDINKVNTEEQHPINKQVPIALFVEFKRKLIALKRYSKNSVIKAGVLNDFSSKLIDGSNINIHFTCNAELKDLFYAVVKNFKK